MPVLRFAQEWLALEKHPEVHTQFRQFSREPESIAPVICLFCNTEQGGDFICEEDLKDHVLLHHGGQQHYRNNVLKLYSKLRPFLGGQLQRAIIRNFSEFQARSSLGWKKFTPAMLDAARSPQGLLQEDR